MTLRVRNFIFISFSLIFVILTTVISLYATGYRLNLTWPLKFNQLLQKTGTLILDSRPTNAKIYITDKSHLKKDDNLSGPENPQKTPVKIKNILPGDYEVRFELEGYWPFSKNLSVYPGESTYLENVDLFRNDLPTRIKETKIQAIKLTADKKYLILTEDKKIIDLRNDEETEITLTTEKEIERPNIIKPKDVKFIDWVDDDNFIYANNFEIYWFDIKSNSHHLLNRFSTQITSLLWHPDGYVIYTTDKEINLIDLKNKQHITRLISLEKISPPILSVATDTLYFTAKVGNQEGLYKLLIK